MKLSPVAEKFVVHWGEMGTRWGINRTVAQIHALLFISKDALIAEEIAETLGVARSNVSNSLRELQSWSLIRIVHVLGDRRDHFETMPDVWEMFQTILHERKKREIDPTLEILRECMAEAKKSGARDSHAAERLGAMSEFFESMNDLYEKNRGISVPAMKRLARLGGKMGELLGLGRKGAE